MKGLKQKKLLSKTKLLNSQRMSEFSRGLMTSRKKSCGINSKHE